MLNLCLPIIESTKRGVLARILEADQAYSTYEIWLDYIEDLDENFVDKLLAEHERKLLLLFRRQNLDPAVMSLEKSRSICRKLNSKQAMVDFDIRTQIDEIKFLKEERISVPTIVSYHNYNLTPPDQELDGILEEMEQYKPSIYKVSSQCRDRSDALRLMSLLLRCVGEGKKCIVLGMGEHGKILRVFGSMWGNELVFAPEQADRASANGQLTLKQLQTIFRELKSDR